MIEKGEGNRITRFSESIDLRRLEREARKLLYAGFLFSTMFYLFLGLFITFRRPEVTPDHPANERRITVDIIEVPRREVIRNPYLDWKGPSRLFRDRPVVRPRRYVLPDGAPRFKQPARPDGPAYRFRSEDFGIDTEALIRAIVRGEMNKVARAGIRDPEKFRLEPYPEVKLTRKSSGSLGRVSMRAEMLRVEDLNTGKYKGLVVLNPASDRDIKGYIYIPAALTGERLVPPRETRRLVAGMAAILKTHTGVIALADSQFALSSPSLAKFPLLYLSADESFDLSPEEQANLGAYLRNGGFAFLEAYGGDDPTLPPRGAGSLKQMLRNVLGSAGELQPLPNDHFLYHSFFDFPEGPPHLQRETDPDGFQPAAQLEGVWLDGRLVAVYSEKGYGREWSKPSGQDALRRFGVNLVVFVLTQPGGLSLRLVDDSDWK
ncbi:MAG: DUF4159 domain-containing protein [Candidatus Latescibacterota bacterium]